MSLTKQATLRVAIPALSLLLGSTLLVTSGAQRPVEQEAFRAVTLEPDEEAPLRNITDGDCTFLQDPRSFLENRELQNAMRTSEIKGVTRWIVSASGTSTALADANSIH